MNKVCVFFLLFSIISSTLSNDYFLSNNYFEIIHYDDERDKDIVSIFHLKDDTTLILEKTLPDGTKLAKAELLIDLVNNTIKVHKSQGLSDLEKKEIESECDVVAYYNSFKKYCDGYIFSEKLEKMRPLLIEKIWWVYENDQYRQATQVESEIILKTFELWQGFMCFPLYHRLLISFWPFYVYNAPLYMGISTYIQEIIANEPQNITKRDIIELNQWLRNPKIKIIDGKRWMQIGNDVRQLTEIELQYEQRSISDIKKSLESAYAKKPRFVNDTLWIKDNGSDHWRKATEAEFEEFKEIRQYQLEIADSRRLTL